VYYLVQNKEKGFRLMETLNTIADPNFSIILPGPCNANCAFCFWKRDENENAEISNYMLKLDALLSKLPKQFTQVSLTGGEPTISKHLPSVLNVLRDHRKQFNKVVLTTNLVRPITLRKDERIQEFVRQFSGVVDYVNVSIHHNVTETNKKILRVKDGNITPDTEMLKKFINKMNIIGIPVNANCVLTNNLVHDWLEGAARWIFLKSSIDDYITEIKRLGFSSISFRKPHTKDSGLEPHPAEVAFQNRKVVMESKCPVCVAKTQIIDGMYVTWKRSVAEPSDSMPDLIYELVYHPDETLAADWSKNIIVEV